MAAAISNSISIGFAPAGSTLTSSKSTTLKPLHHHQNLILKFHHRFPLHPLRFHHQFHPTLLYSNSTTRSNPNPNPNLRRPLCCSASHSHSDSNSASNSYSLPFNFNLKDLSNCLSYLQLKYSDYATVEGLENASEHAFKAEPFLEFIFGKIYSINLEIVLREDDDGRVKKRLNKISRVFKSWVELFLVDETDPDRQYFLKSGLKDVSKCLLENADHWIYGFSNVSRYTTQEAEYLTNIRRPLDLSSTEDTKHIIGCSKLSLMVHVDDDAISFSDKGIHTRQDVEALLQQFIALQGNIVDMTVYHTSFKFDKEKVLQVQGYHHVNCGDNV